MNKPHLPALMKPEEAAAELQVDRTTLYRWMRRGILSSVKIGNCRRFRRSEIVQLAKGNRGTTAA